MTTRTVRFSLQDYQRIMELGKPNLSYVKDTMANRNRRIVRTLGKREEDAAAQVVDDALGANNGKAAGEP